MGHLAKGTDAGPAFIRTGGDFNRFTELWDDRPARREIDSARRLNMHVKRAVVGVPQYALSEGFVSFETAEHQALITALLDRAKARSR